MPKQTLTDGALVGGGLTLPLWVHQFQEAMQFVIVFLVLIAALWRAIFLTRDGIRWLRKSIADREKANECAELRD